MAEYRGTSRRQDGIGTRTLDIDPVLCERGANRDRGGIAAKSVACEETCFDLLLFFANLLEVNMLFA